MKETYINKGKRSLYTAVSAIALTLISGIFAIVVTKLVIANYGSDFNGLNSTANQFIAMLLVIEGGFTIASNVALFKPMAENNQTAINGIISATRIVFLKIGVLFFVVGMMASLVYAFIIKSELSPVISFLVFSMTITSTAFNLVFSTHYRILLQSEQREYILNAIQISTLVLSQILIFLFIINKNHMLFVRLSVVIGAILNTLLVILYARKQSSHLDFKAQPDYASIRGTKDIFIQKITNMVYSTVPVIFISGTVGTVYASVYVVYNNIFRLLKSVIYSFVNAPRIGFGKLIAEKESDYVQKVFMEYEFIISYVMFVFLSATAVLIMPFIRLYTSEFKDVNYYNWVIAMILIATAFFEIIHIPSGNIINMAGKFKVGRKIQSIASVVIIVVMILGNTLWGLYGILLAVLVTAIVLAIMEITYVHKFYFKNSMRGFLRLLVPNLLVMCVVSYLEVRFFPELDTYIEIALAGIIIVVFNAIILIVVNYFANKRTMMDVGIRLKKLVIRNDKSLQR